MSVPNPEDLARDYAEGKPFPYMRAAYGLTDHQIQEFAFDRDLVYGCLRKDDGPRLLTGTTVDAEVGQRQPVGTTPLAGELAGIGDQTALDEARRLQTKDSGRGMVDGMFELHGLLRTALTKDVLSYSDPDALEDFHPARKDVQAARSLRVKGESPFDALRKLGDIGKAIVEMERNNEAPAPAAKGTTVNIDNRSVSINGSGEDSGGMNKTAIDQKSKLAAVMGEFEKLEMRRRARESGQAQAE